jgi:hypothetical protein
MFIRQNKEDNKRLKTKLYNLIIRFVYKYLNKLYDREVEYHNTKQTKPKLYKDFQKTLLDITKWSDKTIEKQCNKFLKWVSKRENLSQNDIQDMIHGIIKLSTQIILDKSDVYITTLLQNFRFPTIKTYYYKCLKRIARIVYENPKNLHNLQTGKLFDELDNVLQSFLPLREIEAILEFDDAQNDNDVKLQKLRIEYNFKNDDSTRNSTISTRHSNEPKLLIDKQPSEPSLQYVSSEDLNFTKESESDSHQNKKAIVDIRKEIVREEGVKHIRIPKMKHSQYYYNKPKINEIEEHFFNE